MASKDDRKKAAEVIANAMTSRSDSAPPLSEEDAILLRMQKAAKDLSRSPFPGRRSQRKVVRLESKNQRGARALSESYVRSVYTTAEEARRAFVNAEPTNPTREVGPGDRYNDEYGCHGKETNNRK